MTRAVLVTHCNGCKRRLHAPNEASFLKQKLRHMRNCGALKLHGQTLPVESLPQLTAAKLARVLPRPNLWRRLLVLWAAIRRAVFG
jgi:hypothetical protein